MFKAITVKYYLYKRSENYQAIIKTYLYAFAILLSVIAVGLVGN